MDAPGRAAVSAMRLDPARAHFVSTKHEVDYKATMRNEIRLRLSAVIAIVCAACTIARAQSFTGRAVDDSSSEPVASAELTIHKAGMRELAADLGTDRNGRFTGADLPAGGYTSDVLKPNFMTASFSLHLPRAPLQPTSIR